MSGSLLTRWVESDAFNGYCEHVASQHAQPIPRNAGSSPTRGVPKQKYLLVGCFCLGDFEGGVPHLHAGRQNSKTAAMCGEFG